MPVVRVRSRRQVTIPSEIFEQLHLEVGDFIEAKVEDGKIMMVPQKLTNKGEAIPLNDEEQEILLKAKRKIDRIKEDFIHSEGLTQEEAKIAAKVGLIDPEQVWWWTEEWQEGERKAEKEIKEGRVHGPFTTMEEFRAWLKSQK